MSLMGYVCGALGIASLLGMPQDATQEKVFATRSCRAGVLVVSSDNHGDYVVLARETQGFRKKGTYDIFGGKKEKGDADAAATAAREWWQEGLGLFGSACTIAKAQESLSPESDILQEVIVNPQQKYITFVVRLDPCEIGMVSKSFTKKYTQLCKAKSESSRTEKDQLALVPLVKFKEALASKNCKVIALVIDAHGVAHKEFITLRGRMIKNLAQFAQS